LDLAGLRTQLRLDARRHIADTAEHHERDRRRKIFELPEYNASHNILRIAPRALHFWDAFLESSGTPRHTSNSPDSGFRPNYRYGGSKLE
jgi:hypothetical protein